MALYVMVDLETQGLQNDAVIASLGASLWDSVEKRSVGSFYVIINIEDALANGFTQDQSTLDWWEKQSPKAKRIFDKEVQDNESVSLKEALGAYADCIATYRNIYKEVYQFGNSSMFDNMKIKTACEKLEVQYPFKHWEDLCYRTVKTLFGKNTPLKREGTFHCAVHDAMSQSKHMAEILEGIPND